MGKQTPDVVIGTVWRNNSDMGTPQSLPILLPTVGGQRWSCHSCGDCCRSLVVHLTADDRERIDAGDWASTLGVAPYLSVKRSWVLNKRSDGACVFLDEQGLCAIHVRSGETAKPLACRMFPFSVRAVADGWQASIRFDCPSVVRSEGEPLDRSTIAIGEVASLLPHRAGRNARLPFLKARVRATEDELTMLTDRLARWLGDRSVAWNDRITVAARLTTTLEYGRIRKVRGRRLAELVQLLLGALPKECGSPPPAPTDKQRGMLRQFAFACSEYTSLDEFRSGAVAKVFIRVAQMRKAEAFRRGDGTVPALPGFSKVVTFDAVESVQPARRDRESIEDLLTRYAVARLESRSVFGAGYYGWPVFRGLGALWLTLAAIGWFARYVACSANRDSLQFADVARAVGIADRAATRLPALGTLAERARLAYLMNDDGLARLIRAYAPVEQAP